jgi:enolase-phosphatase E1
MSAAVSHVLLDIEGTTCPITFVSQTLFPYASDQLDGFLNARQEDPAVQTLVGQVEQAWREDPDPAARYLLQAAPAAAGTSARVVPYLHYLIRSDRKLAALKDLQGMVWEEGYRRGVLQGPLYPDVPPALRRWREAGLQLAVYSSGSVKAQQLLYRYSNAGDLRTFFQFWFDTRIGSKLEAMSYNRIAESMEAETTGLLFISDSVGELKAAQASGLAVLFSDRGECLDTPADSGGFPSITSFDGLDPQPDR